MPDRQSPPPLPPHAWTVTHSMVRRAAPLFPLILLTLGLGMAIYRGVEKLSWADAFLNAAMLLGGMGPVDRLQTTAGKWLAGGYAIFAGLVFITVAGVMLGPVVHAVLHRFHIEQAGDQ